MIHPIGINSARFGDVRIQPAKKQVYFGETTPTVPAAPAVKTEDTATIKTVPHSPQEFFKNLDLVKQLDADQRKEMYKDLRTLHISFWRNQMENGARLGVRSVNAIGRLPIHATRPFTSNAKNWIAKSKENGQKREYSLTEPIRQFSDPATVENSIEKMLFITNLQKAQQTFGTNGSISFKQFEALSERVMSKPESFKSEEELSLAKMLMTTFAVLAEKTTDGDALTPNAVKTFVQNVKNSVPLFYERYGQDAQKYIELNLYYKGAQANMPEVSWMKQTSENISSKLNENTTYRKAARWAKDNQASDTQFLPFYAASDAVYGQTTAYISGLGNRPTLAATVSQMIALDGVFNVIGFFTTKLQILLVGWEKEKPDRQRAQFEKDIKQILRQKQALETKLASEKQKLMDQIKAEPAKEKELTEQFEKTVLKPMQEQTGQLVQNIEKFQLGLDKLLGVKEMGRVEKFFKKPPKLLDDLKYMLPIGMALTIPYEYFYINRYTNFQLELISMKSLELFSFFTFLTAVSNTIMKQIIHVTQDTAKLFQHGKKDELLADNSREFLAGLQGVLQPLANSSNPKAKELGTALTAYYSKMANPLIGNETEQLGTEKAMNREAKLDHSAEKSLSVAAKREELEKDLKNAASDAEKKALKKYRKYLKLLTKIEDRVGYIFTIRSRFDLQMASDQYKIEFATNSDLGKNLPAKYHAFFKDTVQETTNFLLDLEKKYPKAELTYEPLLLQTKTDFDKMKNIFEEGQKGLVKDGSLQKAAEAFQASASTYEEKELAKRVMATLKRTEKGLKKDLYFLTAKSKTEAEADIQAYKKERQDFATATKAMPFGMEKIKRQFTQAGMAAKQVGKRADYYDKYNFWTSGSKWIPAHSGLNVTGRIGFVSIVQGKWIDPLVMLKIWALAQVPYRIYIFGTEKFMLARDAFHREHAEVEKKMNKGVTHYLETLIKEKQPPVKPVVVPASETRPT